MTNPSYFKKPAHSRIRTFTMSTENSTTVPAQDPAKVEEPVENKGKGKAVATEEPTEMSVDDDDDDSSDEEVSFKPPPPPS